jgi:hypothetical protein
MADHGGQEPRRADGPSDQHVDKNGGTGRDEAEKPRTERDRKCDYACQQDQSYRHATLQRFFLPTRNWLRLKCGIFGAEKTCCFRFVNNGGNPPKHKGLLGVTRKAPCCAAERRWFWRELNCNRARNPTAFFDELDSIEKQRGAVPGFAIPIRGEHRSTPFRPIPRVSRMRPVATPCGVRTKKGAAQRQRPILTSSVDDY